jgi:hypothetical protein
VKPDQHLPNWQLVIKALEALNGSASNSEIKAYFKENFPPVKRAVNVPYETAMLSVNVNSRIHYSGGSKVRRTDSGNQYDRLYKNSNGTFEFYNPEKHGVWEIARNDQGDLHVRKIQDPSQDTYAEDYVEPVEEEIGDVDSPSSHTSRFAMESHLRDYLAQNLGRIEGIPTPLTLFTDEDGIPGVEYRTSVGIIDILAKGNDDALYVLELKLGRGPDYVVGQILRYMGWVRSHLANGHPVYGIIVTNETSQKLKYAASEIPGIFLMEYELQFTLRHAEAL